MFYYKRSMHTLSTTRELCTYFLLQKKHMQFPLQENHAYTFSYKRSMHILPYRRTITHTFPYKKEPMHTLSLTRELCTLSLTREACTHFTLQENHAHSFHYKRSMHVLSHTREPCTHFPLPENRAHTDHYKKWAKNEQVGNWPGPGNDWDAGSSVNFHFCFYILWNTVSLTKRKKCTLLNLTE